MRWGTKPICLPDRPRAASPPSTAMLPDVGSSSLPRAQQRRLAGPARAEDLTISLVPDLESMPRGFHGAKDFLTPLSSIARIGAELYPLLLRADGVLAGPSRRPARASARCGRHHAGLFPTGAPLERQDDPYSKQDTIIEHRTHRPTPARPRADPAPFPRITISPSTCGSTPGPPQPARPAMPSGAAPDAPILPLDRRHPLPRDRSPILGYVDRPPRVWPRRRRTPLTRQQPPSPSTIAPFRRHLARSSTARWRSRHDVSSTTTVAPPAHPRRV